MVIALAVVAIVWVRRETAVPRTLEVRPITGPATGLALPAAAGSLRFAVMGDTGRGDARQYDTATEMARWQGIFDFDFVLMLGDNNYGTGSAEDYALRFERPYKQLLDAGVMFQAALGNHDPPGQADYAPFNMGGNRYYTFTKEAGLLPPLATTRVQFFAIDTVTLDAGQLAWLRRELEQSRADWKIAFYHHPVYSSGRYRLAAGRIRNALEPLFVRYGVDVGFSGHEHFYERLIPIQGVQYFTSGAGGALRIDDLRDSPITAAGFDTDTHFMLVEIVGRDLYFQVISRTGQTIDSGMISRPDDPRPPPSLRK